MKMRFSRTLNLTPVAKNVLGQLRVDIIPRETRDEMTVHSLGAWPLECPCQSRTKALVVFDTSVSHTRNRTLLRYRQVLDQVG